MWIHQLQYKLNIRPTVSTVEAQSHTWTWSKPCYSLCEAILALLHSVLGKSTTYEIASTILLCIKNLWCEISGGRLSVAFWVITPYWLCRPAQERVCATNFRHRFFQESLLSSLHLYLSCWYAVFTRNQSCMLHYCSTLVSPKNSRWILQFIFDAIHMPLCRACAGPNKAPSRAITR